ncbi:hypothetical protein CC86DRAFT_34706 [Ophiobolus disseminans]|uniref:Apple domain-containing protein n=1 Tax=Ophiobolus disseminans TaxID=1469910 RepID=A0A6A6ZXI4_9PLEO|nr:hypothetical protein CC86DRAFT_34706 [Ophiobolus disseminans]
MLVISKILPLVVLISLAASQDSDPDPDSQDCSTNFPGSGPSPSNDTSQDFLAFQNFTDAATLAHTPYGYNLSFINQTATVWNNQTFLDFNEVTYYNVDGCADMCNARNMCYAFTIFFQREPMLDPADACPNPDSTTRIICNLYTSAISLGNATYSGKNESQFQIVIAGSNAYTQVVNITVPAANGYDTDIYDNGAAIDAPLDCNGQNTSLGVTTWTDGKSDAQRCADACNANSNCHFANSYFQNLGDPPHNQYCALYTAHWPSWYATNTNNNASISYSLFQTNGTYDACEPFDNLPR